MGEFDVLVGVLPAINVLDMLGVSYAVQGAVASCTHGVVRDVFDAELLTNLPHPQIDTFTTHIERWYAFDRVELAAAIVDAGRCPLVHLDTLLKVDLTVAGTRDIDRLALARAQPIVLDVKQGQAIRLVTPEDAVCTLLRSAAPQLPRRSQDWVDIQGILKLQGDALDLAYLRTQMTTPDLTAALRLALEEAATTPLSHDTTLETEQRELSKMRAWSPTQRFAFGRASSRAAVRFLYAQVRQQHPDWTPAHAALDGLRWRYWSVDNRTLGTRLVNLVIACTALVEAVDG